MKDMVVRKVPGVAERLYKGGMEQGKAEEKNKGVGIWGLLMKSAVYWVTRLMGGQVVLGVLGIT